MDWLRKLPGYQQRAPAGLEWRLLKAMPRWLAAGTFGPLLAALAMHGWQALQPSPDTALALSAQLRQLQLFDFAMWGLVFTVWSLALTVTCGCVIVWMMKGPAYVADGYEVSHSDHPLP